MSYYSEMQGKFVAQRVEKHVSQSCELYDVDKDKWLPLPYLVVGRSRHASCAFNNKRVYVFGGYQTIAYRSSYRNTIAVRD